MNYTEWEKACTISHTEGLQQGYPVWWPSAQGGGWKTFKGKVSEPCWSHVLLLFFGIFLTMPTGNTVGRYTVAFSLKICFRSLWLAVKVEISNDLSRVKNYYYYLFFLVFLGVAHVFEKKRCKVSLSSTWTFLGNGGNIKKMYDETTVPPPPNNGINK